jgi:DNA-binding protein H-NS
MHSAAILVIKDPHAMAKSLSSILSQIERLQKEAASIQLEVIDRVRREIAKYSLTPEQLFGEPMSRGERAAKPAKKALKVRAAKYADGAGNTWGGMGKRPDRELQSRQQACDQSQAQAGSSRQRNCKDACVRCEASPQASKGRESTGGRVISVGAVPSRACVGSAAIAVLPNYRTTELNA